MGTDIYIDCDIKSVDYTIINYEQENELRDRLEDKVNSTGRRNTDEQKILDALDTYSSPIKPVLHIRGRSVGGTNVHLKLHGLRPYFYVPTEQVDSDLQEDDKVTGIENGYTSVRGDNMTKVFTRIPGDVPKLRDEYNHFEADILWPERVMIDLGIEGAIKIPKRYATPEPTSMPVEYIKNSDYNEDSRTLYCDIEVDDSKGFPDPEDADKRIISITVYDSYIEDYKILLYDPKLRDVTHEYAEVIQFDKEEGMLQYFNEYLHTRRFDVMCGWNYSEFDANYLVNRLDNLSDSSDKVDKNDISILGSAYSEGYFGATIKGVEVFDLLRAYKNLQFSELDSYSLENVAQEELGEGKIEHTQNLYELWKNDIQTLVNYNTKDVRLCVELDEKEEIVSFYEEISNYVGSRLSNCIDPSSAVDIKVLRAVNGEFAVPSAKSIDAEEFEGAQVFDPSMGVKDNVVVLDLASLYPFSMKTLNASPETKDPEGDLVAPNGVRFSSDKDAIVVDIIDDLLETRQKYKDLRDNADPESETYSLYDRKQGAVKVVMNCFSGDTFVLTTSGIRNIKDIEVGDEVYSINPDTKDVEIKSVIDTTKQKNMYGELKHINTQHTDMMITPNHRMVFDDGEGGTYIQHFDDMPRGVNSTIPNHNAIDGEHVDKINISDRVNGRFWIDTSVHGRTFRSACPDSINDKLSYSKHRTSYRLDDIDVWSDIPDRIKDMIDSVGVQYADKHSTIPIEYDMDDWLQLLGWVISEGYMEEAGEHGNTSDRVAIAQKQSHHRENIVDLVDRMGLNYSNDDNGVYLYNSNMYHIFKEDVGKGSKNKSIPDWVFNKNMPGEQLENLLHALIDGDGDETGDGTYRYTTQSLQLCQDVIELAVRCGYKCSSSKDSGVYRVYINNNKGSVRPSRADTVDHDGNVYCITVEDNNTLMAGRNGTLQWTGNTLYGVLGWTKFRLYDEDVGAAVTAVGREVIRFTEEVVNDLGYEVTYGDTDSVMIELGDDVTIEEAKEIGFKLEDEINSRYDNFAKDELNADEHFFDIEFEKLYRRYFQAGKKKRYAGHIVWKEGKKVDDIDTVGFETERSDYSPAARNIIESLLDKIVRGAGLSEVSDMIRTEIDKLRDEEYGPDEFGIPSSINKEFDAYDSPTLGVRGSKYANEELGMSIQPGDKPKGMYVKRIEPGDSGVIEYKRPPTTGEGIGYVCWMNYSDIPDSFTFDWDAYIDKQLKRPINRILSGTGWSWSEVISGKRQPRLGEYEFNDETKDKQVIRISVEGKDVEVEDTEDLDIEEGDTLTREQAKEMLENAQQFLEDFDDEDNDLDSSEIIHASAVPKQKGEVTLEDYL